MRSVVDTEGEHIDIRSIYLDGCYFSVDVEQADQLAVFFYTAVHDMLKDICVVDWRFENRRLVNIETSLKNDKAPNGHYTFGTDAFVRTARMKNVTALRKYQKYRSTCISRPKRNVACSSNCKSPERYMETILASSTDMEEAKGKIVTLFNIDNVPYDSEFYHDDFLVHYSCMPMEETNGILFCGHVHLEVSAHAVEDNIDNWAEQLKQLALSMKALVGNMNIHIMLNSGREPYSRYYGLYNSILTIRTDQLELYSRMLYLTEIGWTNLLCSATRNLGIHLSIDSELSIVELADGGLLVGGSNPITSTGVDALKKIKKVLYPTILPRSRFHPYQHLIIRPQWEVVPVFDDEINISEQDLIFEHHGEIDREKLFAQFNIAI